MKKQRPIRLRNLLRVLSLPTWRNPDVTSSEMVWRPLQSIEVRDEEGMNFRGSGRQRGHRI